MVYWRDFVDYHDDDDIADALKRLAAVYEAASAAMNDLTVKTTEAASQLLALQTAIDNAKELFSEPEPETNVAEGQSGVEGGGLCSG